MSHVVSVMRPTAARRAGGEVNVQLRAAAGKQAALLRKPRLRSSLAVGVSATLTQSPGNDEVALQFMVDMKCQGCVTAVEKSLAGSKGVFRVDVDLSAQTVVVLGTASVDDVQAALAASGRKSRLIGQGSGVAEFDDVLAEALGLDMRTLRQSLAAVVEYKGREWGQGDVIGVVRFVQVTQTVVRVEAALSGLQPGVHNLAIHTHGDLTRGVDSVGPVFTPEDGPPEAGYVCSFVADDQGNASVKNGFLDSRVQVWDIVGRSLVLHSGDAPGKESGVVAGVIARSAAVGDNDKKKICACDGTVIWEADGMTTKRL